MTSQLIKLNLTHTHKTTSNRAYLEVGKVVFPGKRTSIDSPVANIPENIHMSSIIWNEQVLVRNIYVYTYKYKCNYSAIRGHEMKEKRNIWEGSEGGNGRNIF